MSLTRTLVTFGLGTALAITAGCGLESNIDRWGDGNDDGYDYGLSQVEVSEASLTGTLDQVTVNQTATTVDAWRDWYSVHVDMYAETTAGPTIMNGFEIYGNLEQLVPGYTSTDYADNYSADNNVQIAVIGCSGRSIYNWDFDDLATGVQYEVSEGPTTDTLTIDYTADFYNWETQVNESVSGSFNLSRSALQ